MKLRICGAVLLCAMVLVGAIACSSSGGKAPNGMTASEILAMTNNATASINTLQGDMTENMSVKGEYMNSSEEMNSSISMSADKPNRKLYESQIDSLSTGVIGEVYILNNWVYIYNPSAQEWVKTPLTEDIWNTEYGADEDWAVWNNSIDAQYIGTELIEGKNCYKINVNPNPAAISDMLNMSGLGVFSSSNTIKSCIVWIDESTYYPLKTSLDMTFESDAMSMEPETFTILANIVFTVSNINQPVNIVLPAEAQNATAISYSTFESGNWSVGNWLVNVY